MRFPEMNVSLTKAAGTLAQDHLNALQVLWKDSRFGVWCVAVGLLISPHHPEDLFDICQHVKHPRHFFGTYLVNVSRIFGNLCTLITERSLCKKYHSAEMSTDRVFCFRIN